MGSGLSEMAELEKFSSSHNLEINKIQELRGLSDAQKQVIKSQPLDDGTIRGGEGQDTEPRTQHHLSFTNSDELSHTKMKSASESGDLKEFPRTASELSGEKNVGQIPILTEAVANLKHTEAIIPINASMKAFQKRRTKGSTSSLSSKDGKGSQSGFGSNLSLDDFYGSNSNIRERSTSTNSLNNDSARKQSSLTMQEKLLLLDHNIHDLQQNLKKQQISQVESIPLEKLGDNAEIKRRREIIACYRLKKFNSTSTLFVDSCLVNSEVEEYLKYFAFYIQNEIRINYESHSFKSAPGPDILSEKHHPLSKHIQFYKKPVSKKDIFRYLECMFQSAELGIENVLITIIYIKRMLRNTSIYMQQINWARIILGAVILASKVWDDHAIWNVDFTQIFPEVTVTDLNELESFYLAALDYNVNVKPGMYAQVYFDLRGTCAFHHMPWALDPLKKSEAKLLMIKGPRVDFPPGQDQKNDNGPEISDSFSSIPITIRPLPPTRILSESNFKCKDGILFI